MKVCKMKDRWRRMERLNYGDNGTEVVRKLTSFWGLGDYNGQKVTGSRGTTRWRMGQI